MAVVTPEQFEKARQRQRRDAPRADDEAPAVRLGTDLHRVVDDACCALGRASDVFQRDAELVRVVRAAEADPTRGVVAGTPQIRPLALATLRETLTRVARWERLDSRSGELRACMPPESVACAVLARGAWSGVAPLSGVVEAPTMRPDGSILDVPGYDAATGLLYEPTCSFPRVADRPTRSDAIHALASLCEVFADFPFATEAARYVPIALVLTLLARPAIRGSTPMITFDASGAGSGKSLGADTSSTIATGRGAPRMTFPPDEAELEKTLASAALFGARLICLDNIHGTLGAAPLDKALTAEDRIAMRILGKSEIREIQWRTVVTATGNNLVLGADTARRTLVCRLEPAVERPEERTGFQHPDLLAHVREQRPKLVRAALTILRAFVVAGRPDASSFTWGSFGQWAELVPAAIVWAGGANVLDCRAVSIGAPDPEAEALRTLLALLPSLVPEGASARTILGSLYPPTERHEKRPPDGWDSLREALETLCPSPRRDGEPPTAQRLGKALRRHVGRVMGGRRLVVHLDRMAGSQVWSVAEGGAS